MLAGALLAACGDDSGSSAATTGGGTTSPAGGITVVATEYKFAVTGTTTGGFVQVRFENDGKEPHILVPFKLKPGKTPADALALLSAQQPDPEQVAAVFDGDPDTSFYGTPGLLPPGDSETTVAHFTPGSYVLACFIPSPDGTPHFALGMLADLTVGEGDTPAPTTQGTFEVTDKTITAPQGVQSGIYEVKNGGSTSSDFNVAGPTDAQVSDVDAAVNDYFGAIGTGEAKTFSVSGAARRRVQRDDAGRRDGIHRDRPEVGSLPDGRQHRREQQDNRERRVHRRLTVARGPVPAAARSGDHHDRGDRQPNEERQPRQMTVSIVER